jgi:hypothetical protein
MFDLEQSIANWRQKMLAAALAGSYREAGFDFHTDFTLQKPGFFEIAAKPEGRPHPERLFLRVSQ